MDLNANFHGVPVKYWLVGASATGFMGFVLYRRRKAKAAASQGTSDSATSGATGPLPGWAGLGDALGPLGGSSPSGPLTGYTSGGVPVYGIPIPDKPVDNQDKGSKVTIPSGETTTPFVAPSPPPQLAPVAAPPPPSTYVIGGQTLPLYSSAPPIQLQVGQTLGAPTGTAQNYIDPSGDHPFSYG